jgi:phosphate transport system substrate-binding protein
MPSSVVETCRLNGCDIVELQIGLGAIVLATNRNARRPRSLRRSAGAGRRTGIGEAFALTVTSWSQLSPHLPNIPIRVIVPVEGSGTRQLFDDLVLEAGCREVRGIRLVFEAAYRRSKCVTMREDGTVIPVPLLDVAAAVFAAPPGTIGVMTLAEVTNSGGNLVALALDGVDPSPATVSSLDYDQTRVIYLYAKRQHARNQRGVGVVRGVSEILVERRGKSGPAAI